MAARCPYFAVEESSRGIRSGESLAAALRRILATPGAHQAPCCYDALSARLVEHAGFPIGFMDGFCVSAARLGLPDVGLISYGEMIDQGCLINEAVSIPVIGVGDNGYGNSMNIKRTIKGYIDAGFAGIMLEDQHVEKVISREEAIMHIKAAVDARNKSGSEIVIVARSDARQAISLDEALWRVKAFADAGADVLFIDALDSVEEMKAFCAVAPEVPKMANMLEGGGKTPILSPAELEEIGFRLVVYPLSLVGVSMRAMQGTNRRTRREPIAVADLEVESSREGNKRQRVVPVGHHLTPDWGAGSSLQSNAVQTGKEPAKEVPKEPFFTCPICWNKMEEPSTTTCGHVFCDTCIKQAIKTQKKCPTCRKGLKMNSAHRIYLPEASS